jgi:DNA-binding transcriptional regulator YdaS (Cro superfamily)
MRKSDVIAYFRTQAAVARALKISRASVCSWGEEIPMRRAYQIERITHGALRAEDPDLEDLAHSAVSPTAPSEDPDLSRTREEVFERELAGLTSSESAA